ncbi:MAG: hypothetical protein KIT73_19725, partial [Burkholderiales bacterium]|nr:hypothetical protein [Burkholderiales bacterium]
MPTNLPVWFHVRVTGAEQVANILEDVIASTRTFRELDPNSTARVYCRIDEEQTAANFYFSPEAADLAYLFTAERCAEPMPSERGTLIPGQNLTP